MLFQYETVFWRGAATGVAFVSAATWLGFAAGMPTGFRLPYFCLFALAALVLQVAASLLLAVLFALLPVPLPRFFIAVSLVYLNVAAVSWTHFNLSLAGAWMITAFIWLLGVLAGSGAALLFRQPRFLTAGGVLYGITALLFAASGCVWVLGPGGTVYPAQSLAAHDSEYMPVVAAAQNPALSGTHPYTTFTYGSGLDRFRSEYGKKADWLSETVDASSFLKKWTRHRTWYSGGDESRLPLNGRVWMPEGEGPFPLVLIVHGSNYMEIPSDRGYAYLGELLASRGMIAVSVDETFINYSTWFGSVEPDMTVRAWLLLKHLEWIARQTALAGSPFYEKADLDRVALIGHSRGGQAAALAAAFRDFFKNEPLAYPLEAEADYRIRTVIAISPTDRMIESRRVYLRDVNYLVLQGSMDADVTTYYGERQFERISWSRESGGEFFVKAALYIQNANHGQFNTEWGNRDITAPTHILLNKRDLLSGQEQREIAKVFISGFLELTLHDRREYLPIFRDFRAARPWLPDTGYLNRYQSSGYVRLQGESVEASGFDENHVMMVPDRRGHSTGNEARYLKWDGEEEAVLRILLAQANTRGVELTGESVLSLDIANAMLDPRDRFRPAPDPLIEFRWRNGEVTRERLSRFMPISPPFHARFTKSLLFEKEVRNGRFSATAEAVFQTVRLPLSRFVPAEPESSASLGEWLEEIRLVFPEGRSGQWYIDQIGFDR